MTNSKHIIHYSKIVILGILLSVGVSYLYAWSGPTAAAPGDNAQPPLHTGAGDQVKSGGLGVTNLVTDGLTVTTGAGVGKVLTSDAVGKATWQDGAGGGAGTRVWVGPWQQCQNVVGSFLERKSDNSTNEYVFRHNLGELPYNIVIQGKDNSGITYLLPPGKNTEVLYGGMDGAQLVGTPYGYSYLRFDTNKVYTDINTAVYFEGGLQCSVMQLRAVIYY